MEERSLKDVTVVVLRSRRRTISEGCRCDYTEEQMEERYLKDVTVIRLRSRWRNDI